MIFVVLVAAVSSKTRYGIMVDAGSSGTRAHLYMWEATKGIPNVHPVPNSSAGLVHKVRVPLAKAAKNMSIVAAIFDPIIEFAAKNIPANYLSHTRMFVYATAGMRLLSDIEQEQVIAKTFDHLTTKSPFKIKRNYVRVIDGIEEGVFGWLSVNHLLGNFLSGQKTVGALDMGGASFQVALEVGKGEKALHTVTLGSKVIPLYAHSYLGYGANEALKAISRSLFAILPAGAPVEHPCYPRNYHGMYKERQFVGTGDFDKCSALTQEILLGSTVFESVEVPSLKTTNEFVAMASFYYANSFLKLSPQSSLEDLKKASSDHCATDWNKTAKEHGDNEFVLTYCWYSIYQWNMLHKGYNFEDGKTKVAKLDDINGVDLSWTIGAMLSHVAEIEIDDQPTLAFHSLIAANVVAFFILFPLYVWMERRRRAPRRFSGK